MKEFSGSSTTRSKLNTSSDTESFQEECSHCKKSSKCLKKVCTTCFDEHFQVSHEEKILSSPQTRPKANTFSYTERRPIKTASRTTKA